MLQTISADAFQRDVCFVNLDLKHLFNGSRIENFADILDRTAVLTEEVCVRMCVSVIPFFPLSVGSDLQNVARVNEESKIAVDRPQTDVRDLLPDTREDHIGVGVIVTALKIPEDRVPLSGIFQHWVNHLSMLGIIPVFIIP